MIVKTKTNPKESEMPKSLDFQYKIVLISKVNDINWNCNKNYYIQL